MARLEVFDFFTKVAGVQLMKPRVSAELYMLLSPDVRPNTSITKEDLEHLIDRVKTEIEDFDNPETEFIHREPTMALIMTIGSSIKRGLPSTIAVIGDDNFNKNWTIIQIWDLLGCECVLENDKISCEDKFRNVTFLFVPSFDKLNLKETSVDYFIIDNYEGRKDLNKIKESITEYGKTHTVKTIIYEKSL